MTKLEELREFQKELDNDPDFVDVKFFAGNKRNATDEEIAADALILIKGSENAVDVTDEIL